MLSHFGSYIYERQNKSIIEDEDGFATYYFVEGLCYIEDIYVVPAKRKSGIAAKYADQIAAEAKLKGAKALIGTVKPSTQGSTESLKVLLAYGFRLETCVQDFIFFRKNLEA